ncbi:MAG: 3-deoxy-D-manno-octulosonic acid transferase [Paludibacteraceae bacterium]|nr:3-deoxy-D-manno-octulosonic acid transferase [Paludibacteraceae bacterium]
MYLYFLLIRIAALFGHKKARLLVRGQAETLKVLTAKRPDSTSGLIWLHAASVGEFEQARPLIERLRSEQPQRRIIVTFFSPSGYEMRKNYNQADGVYYLPFATRRNARRFLDALQPDMAIFVKYEFWPAYLRELKKRNIPTYSISAIFRPEQLFFRPWGKAHLALLNCFTHIYVQDEASLRLLQSHGVTHTSVAGDTRFDRMAEVTSHPKQIPVIEQFTAGCDRVIVAGSTWPEDEQLLAEFISSLPTGEGGGRDSKLILVPHEIDEKHLHQIFEMFEGRMVRFTRATPVNIRHTQVLVVDTMGLLSSIYPYGQAAYIGGGFGVGIHNTIEAAAYGMPVIFGPNYHHFREAKGLIAAGAAESISNYTELEQALTRALDNHAEMGAKAAAYVRSELGATDKIYNELFNHQPPGQPVV